MIIETIFSLGIISRYRKSHDVDTIKNSSTFGITKFATQHGDLNFREFATDVDRNKASFKVRELANGALFATRRCNVESRLKDAPCEGASSSSFLSRNFEIRAMQPERISLFLEIPWHFDVSFDRIKGSFVRRRCDANDFQVNLFDSLVLIWIFFPHFREKSNLNA